MDDIRDSLIDVYANALGIAEQSYEMMGRLLDKEHLKKRIASLDIKELYIYGGGYLGIQAYQSCSDLLKIPAIIDKRGGLLLNIPDIPVINLKELKNIYRGETIVITPIKYYEDIKKELASFIPENKVIFLGEFLEGI